MRITVLTYLEDPSNRASYDIVAKQVASALRTGGHDVTILGVHNDVTQLVSALKRRKPDLVFNLLESFSSLQFADVAVAGVLSAMQLCYTGGGPGELYIRQDKSLAKKLLAFDHIRYPDFAVFSQNAELETAGKLRLPLFVKPLQNDASIGIGTDSLVRDATTLMKRVVAIHEKQKDAALVEEYIEGRELCVGILGNREPQALPPVEIDFSGLPEGVPHILGSKAKWAIRSREYQGTNPKLADLAEPIKARLQKVSLDAYRALRVRDYGRVDLRLTDTLEIYVIEVNANCYLEKSSEFVIAAAAAGLDYPALINRIAELAFERYGK